MRQETDSTQATVNLTQIVEKIFSDVLMWFYSQSSKRSKSWEYKYTDAFHILSQSAFAEEFTIPSLKTKKKLYKQSHPEGQNDLENLNMSNMSSKMQISYRATQDTEDILVVSDVFLSLKLTVESTAFGYFGKISLSQHPVFFHIQFQLITSVD